MMLEKMGPLKCHRQDFVSIIPIEPQYTIVVSISFSIIKI